MSSILKALKKLENEQAGQSSALSTGTGGQFVAPVRGGQSLLLLVTGIGAGLLAAGGLYVVYGRSDMANAPPVVQEQKVTGAPAKPVAVVVPATVTKIDAAAPARIQPAAPVRPVAPVVPPVAAKTVSATIPLKSPTETPGPAHSEPMSQEKPQVNPVGDVHVERREIPAPGQQWTAPSLAVSDIMPASGGGRMAIVNGMPVMEGTMIDEMLVEKIGENQVVFVVQGRTVTVALKPEIGHQ